MRQQREQLEQERDRLRQDNEKLKRLLKQALRANKRQAAPFSRGKRKENARRPGRKSGTAYGRHHRKRIPEQVDEVIAVPPPAHCPDPNCGGALEVEDMQSQYQQEIVRQTIRRRFDIPICRCTLCHQRVQGAKEAQALNEFTNKTIDRDHTFCLQFAEWDMHRPLIRAGGAEAIVGQIGALSDAHAGVTDQKKRVASEIIPAEELPIEELVRLSGEGAWQTFGEARNVLCGG